MFHWHPAKAQFEWRRDLDIKHSMMDILAGQYFANLFIMIGERDESFIILIASFTIGLLK